MGANPFKSLLALRALFPAEHSLVSVSVALLIDNGIGCLGEKLEGALQIDGQNLFRFRSDDRSSSRRRRDDDGKFDRLVKWSSLDGCRGRDTESLHVLRLGVFRHSYLLSWSSDVRPFAASTFSVAVRVRQGFAGGAV